MTSGSQIRRGLYAEAIGLTHKIDIVSLSGHELS